MPADTERFRLRRFVDRLVELGECEVYDQPIDLVDIAAVLDGNRSTAPSIRANETARKVNFA